MYQARDGYEDRHGHQAQGSYGDQYGQPARDGYGPQPPPYNAQGYGISPYSGVRYQGKEQIAVISPPYTYDNMSQPGVVVEGQQSSFPPDEWAEDVNVFSERTVRRGFIRKVYLTLMVQLLVTVGIICACLYWTTLRVWLLVTPWFMYGMMVTTIVLVLFMACCIDLRRKVPLNFIALGLFTIAEGLMLGSLAAYFSADAVMWAVGATAVVSLSLTIFSLQTKWDFTGMSGCLWVFVWTLFSFGLLCAILRTQYLHIVYACLGTLLFSFYLVMDTQHMLGGAKKYTISPEEYIFAALNLYLDVVTLFIFLLQLFSLCE